MFSIAICDDDELFCNQIEKCIKSQFDNKDVKIEVYYSGEKLCEDLSSGVWYDLIFLDIELIKMSGVDVGRIIRKKLKNEKIHIVYVSSKREYAMELFSVRPLNFLIKPIKENDIKENVKKAINLSATQNDFFEFKHSNELFRIPLSCIMYFESKGRKIKVHEINKTYELYCKLDEVESRVGDSFVRIHKSYLINNIYIKSWKYENIFLQNEIMLPISHTYRKIVRSKLIKNYEKGTSL